MASDRPETTTGPSGEVETARIDLPGGWYLVRDVSQEWFLSSPGHIWVAKFWDGAAAAASDVRAFAKSLGVEL